MGEQQTVVSLDVQGRKTWLKTYGGGNRRYRLALLSAAVNALGLPALRPPPRRGGEYACAVELRRLKELAACGALAPEVLGVGKRTLLIGDIGQTLASVLKNADNARREQLVQQAAETLARLHGNGGYVGQPLARNLTMNDQGQIGFLDMEEDPREVMTLEQAQVRDWLVFAAGVSRYFEHPEQALAAIFARIFVSMPNGVRLQLSESVDNLRIVGRISNYLGHRARRISGALRALREALPYAAVQTD